MASFPSSLKPVLIYVFAISDESHKNCLKIGKTTLDEDVKSLPEPNSSILNKAAHHRIDQYTKTAGVAYQLLYTEIAIFYINGKTCSFSDSQVHHVLERSGIKKKIFDKVTGANEWYCCDLETIKKAIQAVKHGKSSLNATEITQEKTPIIFRPEQRSAIDKTIKQFAKGNQMLWNAKMRFGKTLSALQVVKEENFNKTLIITHRPVVDEGWFEDFNKIFYDSPNYYYGSKTKGESFQSLQQLAAKGKQYVYFVSMQDMRGSDEVGGNFKKDAELYNTTWDFLIIDEAHEGTNTELGTRVLTKLIKETTKVLRLSGTPFNLIDNYTEKEIFTWDYTMEQKAKANWDLLHMGDPNPYAILPRLNIYTYDLGSLLNNYADDEKAFNFREFFRVQNNGTFLHSQDVDHFLNLLCKEDNESLYPYSNKNFREIFRHTLWMVPGVASARALSNKLKKHPVFGTFKIVNVAGNGDDEEENEDALQMVNKAIGTDPGKTWTITLSCGKLTTGVSVKPWTAVFMMAGSFSTSASSYMQTIFRVQTPFTYHGRIKTECYAFDFAPDRTLKILAEVAHISAKAGKQSIDDRHILGEFLNFCPIVSIEGSQMTPYDVNKMLAQLKKAQIERVINGGFEDGALYNEELLNLSDVELIDFKDLRGIIGRTKAMEKTNEIDINNQGFTNEEHESKSKNKKNATQEPTSEEKEKQEELKRKQKLRKEAISILRGISIRMPLLLYGAELKNEEESITIDNFLEIVDDKSWKEFMPKGVTKEVFAKFKKYYDPDIFREAGKRIREIARAADKFSIEERIERIASIFNTFRNPDKETVLTPWRVVNMHMSDCLGGYCFYDKDFKQMLDSPVYIEHNDVTSDVFSINSQILEINSKSGLYPLYCAYSIYRSRIKSLNLKYKEVDTTVAQSIWKDTVENNIFVICKTPMARSISIRTLVGFKSIKVNASYYPDIINEIIKNQSLVTHIIRDGKNFWHLSNNKESMKFKAIVGNPPYQMMDGGAGASAVPIYNKFVEVSKAIKPKFISLVMPARWYSGGRGLDEFRKNMLADHHMRELNDYINGREVFNNVEIKGGVCYFLWDSTWNNKCEVTTHVIDSKQPLKSLRFLQENDADDIFIRDPRLLEIKKKVESKRILLKEKTFNTIVSSMKPYGLRGDFFKSQKKYNLPSISDKPIEGGIVILGLDDKQHRIKKYAPNDYPIPNKDGIDKYKIFVPRNYGSGKLQDCTFKTYLACPSEICTETFIQIYPFNNTEERDNCNKYMSTKFFRLIVELRKQDQSSGKDVYTYVPLENFTNSSDINWNKPIDDISRQLYKKYNLTAEEIEFVENNLPPQS